MKSGIRPCSPGKSISLAIVALCRLSQSSALIVIDKSDFSISDVSFFAADFGFC
jgi:hypothetical protein